MTLPGLGFSGFWLVSSLLWWGAIAALGVSWSVAFLRRYSTPDAASHRKAPPRAGPFSSASGGRQARGLRDERVDVLRLCVEAAHPAHLAGSRFPVVEPEALAQPVGDTGW